MRACRRRTPALSVRRRAAHTEPVPDDAAWADHVVVPDDIRDLQPDIDDYHRELRLAARMRRWGWLLTSPFWQRWSFPLGVVTGAVALAAVLFGLLAIESSPVPGLLAREPLATPAAPVGTDGGLLPATPLRQGSVQISARDVRPAIVVLMPLQCRCDGLLASFAAQAAKKRTRLALVAPGPLNAEVSGLAGRLDRDRVIELFDANATLAKAFHAQGVTVLAVEPDGIVAWVKWQVTTATEHLPLEGFPVLPAFESAS